MKLLANGQFAVMLLVFLFGSIVQHSVFAETTQYRAADVEECLKKLSSDNQLDRASAGETLSEMGPIAKTAVPALTKALEDTTILFASRPSKH